MAEAKLEIKIGEIRIELEGSSEFVANHYDKIEKHLETYVKLSHSTIPKKTEQTQTQVPPTNSESNGIKSEESSKPIIDSSELPETFGEWLNSIPRDTKDTDKALLAGYFAQLKSDQKTFRSRDISKLLKEHSIKLSNTSQFVKQLVDTKKIFQHSKNGSEANFKVSRETELGLKELFK